MAITHPARRATGGPDLALVPDQRHPDASPTAVADPDLRDRLTRSHLRTAAEAPEAGDVLAFRPRWWDGSARVPALILRLPETRGHRRCRVVDVGGQVVALPASAWRARRVLRRLRRPVSAEPGLLSLAHAATVDDARPRVTLVADDGDRPRGRPSLPRRARTGPPRRVLVQQTGDSVRCCRTGCSGLIPVPPPGRLVDELRCSCCGRSDIRR